MAVAEDKTNTLAIVTIGIASVLLLWASIVALQAYYANTFGAEMKRKFADGQDAELRTLLADQRAGLQALRRNDDETVRIPIDRAKQLVVAELRAGQPASLVPAVGPHTEPTVPAIWGRPADGATIDDEADDEAEGEFEGADAGEDSGAEAAEDPEAGDTSPIPAPRAIDPSQGGAPTGAQEGDDANDEDADTARDAD
jgi:hypothetical protein